MHLTRGVLFIAAMAGLAVTVAAALPVDSAPTDRTPEESPSPNRQYDRLREGTELTDAVGTFRLTGDRAAFTLADGSARFGSLENLALERVVTAIAADPTPLEWIVSGTVTEYKGSNYLLLTRAILKPRSTTPERRADRTSKKR